jgi:subtilisin family serine protease
MENFITSFLRGVVLGLLVAYIFQSCDAKADVENVIKIAVVDTGYDMSSTWSNNPSYRPQKICGTYDGFKLNNVKDVTGHGTGIVGVISKLLNDSNVKYCLYIIRALPATREEYVDALRYASALDVDIVNISATGFNQVPGECAAIKNMISNGIIVLAAGGNENISVNTISVYPAFCDTRVYKVFNVDDLGHFTSSSNTFVEPLAQAVTAVGTDILTTGPNNTMVRLTGTSISTAIYTAKIAKALYLKERCRLPNGHTNFCYRR